MNHKLEHSDVHLRDLSCFGVSIWKGCGHVVVVFISHVSVYYSVLRVNGESVKASDLQHGLQPKGTTHSMQKAR